MTTIFSTKKTLKNRFSKRILGMESLESREMLSVNPLGVDNYFPDYVQNATEQNFQTESGEHNNAFTSVVVAATDVGFTLTVTLANHTDAQGKTFSLAVTDSEEPVNTITVAGSGMQEVSGTSGTTKADTSGDNNILTFTVTALKPGTPYLAELTFGGTLLSEDSFTSISGDADLDGDGVVVETTTTAPTFEANGSSSLGELKIKYTTAGAVAPDSEYKFWATKDGGLTWINTGETITAEEDGVLGTAEAPITLVGDFGVGTWAVYLFEDTESPSGAGDIASSIASVTTGLTIVAVPPTIVNNGSTATQLKIKTTVVSSADPEETYSIYKWNSSAWAKVSGAEDINGQLSISDGGIIDANKEIAVATTVASSDKFVIAESGTTPGGNADNPTNVLSEVVEIKFTDPTIVATVNANTGAVTVTVTPPTAPASGGPYKLFYEKSTATDTWTEVGDTTITVDAESPYAWNFSGGDWSGDAVTINGLLAGSYVFRLGTGDSVNSFPSANSNSVDVEAAGADFGTPSPTSDGARISYTPSVAKGAKSIKVTVAADSNTNANGYTGTENLDTILITYNSTPGTANTAEVNFAIGNGPITVTGLVPGAYKITITEYDNAGGIGSSVDTTTLNFAVSDVPPGEIAVTGGTTVTGLTTNAATITLPKVQNAKKYDVYVNGVITVEDSTKNQVVLTGLAAGTKYEISVIPKDNSGKALNLDGTAAADQSPPTAIALGAFSTWANTDAADVKNPAINGGIAASYATSGKNFDGKTIASPGIKVTWKAPANYTGAYTVEIQQVKADGTTEGSVATKIIPAGYKAEAFIIAANGFTVTKDAYYKVTVVAGTDIEGTDPAAVIAPEVVVATGTNKIENYNSAITGTITAPANAAALGKVARVTATSGTDKVEATWAAVTNATGYLVTLQDGKGIVYQGVVTGVAFDSSTVSGLKLVSGIKYDVSVSSVIVDGNNAVKAAAAKGSATTVKFSEPNLKFQQSEKAKLTTVKLAIDDKITDPTTSARKYVIEYTYIADAKGKADWSTAKVQAATSTSLDLAGLKAGTQYYARVVAYDSTGNATTANSTKISIGKEFKFKTLAAPLATITKPAFALDGNNLALKFTGKVPVDKVTNGVLEPSTKFFYELIVSTDAVIDKATGKLANGQSFTTTPVALISTGSGRDKDVFDTPITQVLTGTGGVFEELSASSLDPATFKALNFQLLVYYSTSDNVNNTYATAYTKVAKLALPKWFV